MVYCFMLNIHVFNDSVNTCAITVTPHLSVMSLLLGAQELSVHTCPGFKILKSQWPTESLKRILFWRTRRWWIPVRYFDAWPDNGLSDFSNELLVSIIRHDTKVAISSFSGTSVLEFDEWSRNRDNFLTRLRPKCQCYWIGFDDDFERESPLYLRFLAAWKDVEKCAWFLGDYGKGASVKAIVCAAFAGYALLQAASGVDEDENCGCLCCGMWCGTEARAEWHCRGGGGRRGRYETMDVASDKWKLEWEKSPFAVLDAGFAKPKLTRAREMEVDQGEEECNREEEKEHVEEEEKEEEEEEEEENVYDYDDNDDDGNAERYRAFIRKDAGYT